MARHFGGIAGLAAGVVVASLVVAQVITGRGDTGGQVIALFIVLLLAAFVLLAVAIVDSEHGVEQLSASPRWSLRIAIRRLARRLRAAITRFGRRVIAITRGLLVGAVRGTRTGIVRLGRRSAAIIHDQVRRVVRAPRTAITRLRESLNPERWRGARDALRRAGRTTLIALGLPPEEEARKHPREGLDDMPTLRRARSRRSEVSRRPKRRDVDPLRRTFGPERRPAARDAPPHRR